MDEGNKYDFFISHASEDKDTFVRELAIVLENQGFSVWYDEFTLKIGDSLTDSINKGVKCSLYGLVVLSKNFFKKEWAKKELNAFLSKEIIFENNVLLPIWLDVTKQEVFEYSPLIADKFALTGNSVGAIIDALSKRVEPKITTDVLIKEKIEFLLSCDKHKRKREQIEILNRMDRIFAYQSESYSLLKHFVTPEDFVEYTAEQDYYFLTKEEELRKEYSLPKGLWLIHEPFNPSQIEEAKVQAVQWINKNMLLDEALEFVELLNEWLDTDIYYILLGFPHNTIKLADTYDYAIAGIIKIGTDDIESIKDLE